MTADFSVATAITADDQATRPVDRFARALSTRVVGAADKAKAALGRLAGAARTAVIGGAQLTTVLGAAAGGFAIKVANDFTVAGDELGEFSARVGLNVTALQEYRFAAERSGAGLETFNGAITKFNTQLGKLKAGTGGLGKFMAKATPELKAQVLAARDSEEAFRLMLEGISRLEDPTEKAALAQAAFGGAGSKMILMAKGGTESLDKLRVAAHRFGLLTEADTEAAGAYADSLDDLTAAWTGMKFAIGRSVVPILKPMVDKLTDWIAANREVVGLRVAEWFDAVGTAAGNVYRYLRDEIDWAKVGTRFQVIVDIVGAMADRFIRLIDLVKWAIDAVGGLQNALLLLLSARILKGLHGVATSVGLIGSGAAAAGGAGAAGAAGAGAFGAASKLAIGGAAGIAAGLAWLGWSEMSKDGDWLEAANQNAPSDALAGGALAASGGVVGSVQGLASSRNAEIASRMNSEQLVNAFKTAIEVGFDGQEFWGELVRRGFDVQKLAEYRRATSATVDGTNLWNLDALAAARRAQMKIEVDFKNAPPNMTATVAERPADVPTTLKVGRRQ